jgi:hypothetical protein
MRKTFIAGAAITVFALAGCGSAAVASHPAAAPKPKTSTSQPAAVPKTTSPAATAPATGNGVYTGPDPFNILKSYYDADISNQDYQAAWLLLSPGMQDKLGPYSSWAAGYANSGGEMVLKISESGGTVQAYLITSDSAGATGYWKGTWTVDNAGLISSASTVKVSGLPASYQNEPGVPATSAATPTPVNTNTTPELVPLGGSGIVKPTTIDISGDATNIPSNLVWSSWTDTSATATGTITIEGCVPDCASGSQTSEPVTITLGGVTNGASGPEFTTMTEDIAAGPAAGITTYSISGQYPHQWPHDAS